jgi:hypothetical protein
LNFYRRPTDDDEKTTISMGGFKCEDFVEEVKVMKRERVFCRLGSKTSEN